MFWFQLYSAGLHKSAHIPVPSQQQEVADCRRSVMLWGHRCSLVVWSPERVSFFMISTKKVGHHFYIKRLILDKIPDDQPALILEKRFIFFTFFTKLGHLGQDYCHVLLDTWPLWKLHTPRACPFNSTIRLLNLSLCVTLMSAYL